MLCVPPSRTTQVGIVEGHGKGGSAEYQRSNADSEGYALAAAVGDTTCVQCFVKYQESFTSVLTQDEG